MANQNAKRNPIPFPAEPVNVWALLEQQFGAVLMVRPKNSVTAREYAEKIGISRKSASDRLNVLVEQGKLKRDRCMIDDHVTNVYTPLL